MHSNEQNSEPDRNQPVGLDIIIPMYNEEAVVDALMQTLLEVFSDSACRNSGIKSVHVIAVDDGSADATVPRLRAWMDRGVSMTILCLSRNFGQQNAFSAGMAHSRAQVCALMDADLQDPPALLLDMVRQWRAGQDIIYGRRMRRSAGLVKRMAYWSFYRIFNFLAEDKLPVDSGDFCLMDARALAAINSLPEVVRFPRGLRSWVGFRQAALPFDRPPRRSGSPKYTFRKLYNLAIDGFTSMSLRPLIAARIMAAVMAAGCALMLILMWGKRLLPGMLPDSNGGWTPLLLTVVLVALMAQLTGTYITGAYLSRAYIELKRRPPYIIARIFTSNDAAPDDNPQ
jgi:dolichol-phosphate mannosyltransferase